MDGPLSAGGIDPGNDPPIGTGANRRSYRGLLLNADYVRVLGAGLGSVCGSAIAVVALTWIVAERTGSALDVAVLGAALVVSSAAFSVFGGTLVDRYDPRFLMVASDLSRAGAMSVAVIDLRFFGFDLRVLAGVYAAVGAFGTVFNPAENAIIPRLLPAAQIADANGMIRSSRSALLFAGSGIGGVLIVTVGPLWGLVANVATFLVSAGLLTGVRQHLGPSSASTAERRGSTGYLADLTEGFRWLYRSLGFFELTLSATVFNFCSTLVGTFLVFYATDLLHGSAITFALLLALEVAGSAVGALLVGPLGAVRWAGRAWTIPYGVVSGAVALLLGLYPDAPVAFAALFALGALGGFAGTAWLSAAQTLVPPDMMGRYFGIDNLGSVVIIPVAQIGGALLIAGVGLRSTYVLAAVIWIVGGLLFLLPRALWNLGVGPPTLRSAGAEPGRPGSPGENRGA